MRIGLDFDGTIADITWAKVRYAREAFGVDLAPEQTARPSAEPVLGRERYDDLVRVVHGSDLSLEMPPMPGALEVIDRLTVDHELIVVTARLDDEALLARQWLQAHEVPVSDLVHTARGSKADACRALDIRVHLDDLPRVFADIDHARTLPALIDTPYNRTQSRLAHVRVVEHWLAFEALVGEIASGELAGPGVRRS
jgi:uncharacterized HAD superfamily protein